MKNLFSFAFSIDWDDSAEKDASMRRPFVSLTIDDYRQLLLRKPKSEIVKIDVCDRDWDLLLRRLRERIAQVQDPHRMLVSIEIPVGQKMFRAKDLHALFAVLTASFEPKPTLTWGVAEVDTAHFRVVVYAG